MKNIIYSKYSNERAEQFKIRTDIVEDLEGKKYVQKNHLLKKQILILIIYIEIINFYLKHIKVQKYV